MLEIVDFLGAAHLAGIVLMGTTGEFVHFELDDRARLVSLAAKRSRVPVIVNVTHSTLDGAVQLANQAAKDGAAGLLLMPPYFLRYSREVTRGFFRQFIEEFDGGLPVYLYNIPAVTSPLSPPAAIDLLETGLFAGIKDSSGDWDGFLELLEAARALPFTLLAGNEKIYVPARAAGAHGIISGAASAIPELILALDAAILAGDETRRDRLQARMLEFVDWIERFPMTFGIKEAAAMRGLKTGATALALSGSAGELMTEYRAWFPSWWAAVRQEIA